MGEIKVGAWYQCAICAHCRQPIPLFEVVQGAPVGGDLDAAAFRGVSCPSCQHVADYSFRQTVQVQCRNPHTLH